MNQWGFYEIFANKTNYLLELLLWQNSYDPKKKSEHKANKPKPFIPDFMKDKSADTALKDAERKTTEDIRDILAKPRQ